MRPNPDETLMRAAFAPARELEPTPREIASVLERVERGGRGPVARRPRPAAAFGRRRLVISALAALILLAGGAYAVPPTRAALEDLADELSGWIAGEESDAPGRPLGTNEDAPAFMRDQRHSRDPRVVAQTGRYKLYATVQPGYGVTFELGDTGVGLGFPAEDLFEGPLYVLGPGAMGRPDSNGHVPLFGVTAGSVKSVELVYESGPPTRADSSDGGFVLLAEPARHPREVIALDAGGEPVGTQLVDDSPHKGPRIDWEHYLGRHGKSRPSQPR